MRTDELLETARRHLWWLAPLVVLLINLVVLSTYRSLYSGRVEALSAAIEEESNQLDRLTTQAEAIENLVARSEAAQEGVDALYLRHFGSESQRLTRLIREVRDLANRAGVNPDRISYPQELFEDYGLIKRSMAFVVDGSYRELRLFVNYLELSDSFIVLESLGLQDSKEGGLRIQVLLSTLFSGRDEAFAMSTTDAGETSDG